MPTHYVYAIGDPRDGLYRYVGGAYGNANRVNDHSATRGAKSTRAWFASLGDTPPVRRILFSIAEDDKWAERATWLSLKALSHPLLNDCPGEYSKNIHSPAARAKMSAARKGVPLSEAHRAALGESMKSSPKAVANRAALSEAKKGVPLSEAHRVAVSEGMKMSTRATVHLTALHDSSKGVPKSADHRAAIRQALKGVPKSTTHRAALGESAKSSPKAAVHLVALHESKKGVPLSENHRAAISESLKGKPQRCGCCGELGHNRRYCESHRMDAA